MSIEGLNSKPVNKGEAEMYEESLDKKVAQTTGLIRTYAEMVLQNAAENRAGAWGFLEKVGLGRRVKEMDEVTLTPTLKALDECLKPMNETVPLNNEEVQTLLAKLDTPSFQEKIRASLQVSK